MALAVSLKEYLASQGIAYDVITHPRAVHMTEAARKAGVSSDLVVKTVVLRDEDSYLLAAIPASHHLELGTLHRTMNRQIGLASEDEFATLFKDCEPGALPPVGTPYGLEVLVDDSLAGKPDLYFEGGDHCSLVHVTAAAFAKLMSSAKHGRFSHHD